MKTFQKFIFTVALSVIFAPSVIAAGRSYLLPPLTLINWFRIGQTQNPWNPGSPGMERTINIGLRNLCTTCIQTVTVKGSITTYKGGCLNSAGNPSVTPAVTFQKNQVNSWGVAVGTDQTVGPIVIPANGTLMVDFAAQYGGGIPAYVACNVKVMFNLEIEVAEDRGALSAYLVSVHGYRQGVEGTIEGEVINAPLNLPLNGGRPF